MTEHAKKRVNWKRVGLCLLILLGGLWLVEPLVLHVEVWYLARKESRDPRLSILPQRMPDTAMASLEGGSEERAFGYAVDLPWKVIKRSDSKTFSVWSFENGSRISFVNEEGEPPGQMLVKSGTPAAQAQAVYGSLEQGSRYEWFKAEFEARPSDISFWHSRAGNVRAMVFLLSKAGMIGKATAVYSLAAGGMHGFQVGDPQIHTTSVCLWLFDAKDREFWMILRRSPNGTGFTQEQINAVIASMRPVAP